MKVVALVSGGKDSCFNILHCLANGHEIIALANLKPAIDTVQELDSFMFQTVGHDILNYYSECIDLPMYRGLIHGTSKNQLLDYSKTESDEIEDLYQLLVDVKERHPDLEAVSVGAILSSYQRTRVENVCQRLGLTSLAYLWQRNQLELMTEMVRSSMDAILIKVAAIGLNENHLGKTLKEMYPIMLSLNQKFEVHICGEGGEFESLVLDAPFFVKKLEIVKSERIVGNDGVAYLKPIVRVVEKSGNDVEYHNIKSHNVDWSKFLSPRNQITEKFQNLYESLPPHIDETETIYPSKRRNSFKSSPIASVKQIKNKLFISNLTSGKPTVDLQVQDVFAQLVSILSQYSIDTSHIQHSTLLVTSMSNFQSINSIYAKNFTNPLPPSRVCVETLLPKGIYLQLSVVTLVNSSVKKGLHVQGRSYWAPANIGPYSQVIIDESLVGSLSGQIPLIPESMELSKKSPSFNTVLSLQHFDSVKEVIGCVNQLSTVAYIKSESLVSTVVKAWEGYSALDSTINPFECLIIVQVTELPRGANVEWGGLSYKKLTNLYEEEEEEEDDDDDDDECFNDIIVEELDETLNLQESSLIIRGNNKDYVCTLALTTQEFQKFKFSNSNHYTIYTKPENVVNIKESSSIDFIPVLNTWNYRGELKDYCLVVR